MLLSHVCLVNFGQFPAKLNPVYYSKRVIDATWPSYRPLPFS